MAPIRSVLFDMDGTLLNTLDDLRDSVNFALSQYCFPTRTLEEIRRFVGNGVKKLMEDYAKLKNEFSDYKLSVIRREAEMVEITEGNLVIGFEEATTEQLIAFSNIALDKISGILVLLSGYDGDYKYVISSNSIDLRAKISDINKSLLGRGGGRANMVQGSFGSSLADIKLYFNP